MRQTRRAQLRDTCTTERSPARRRAWKAVRNGVVVLLPLLLGGCNLVVLFPSGAVAMQQRDLLVTSTILMLLIIVPVIALTLMFAWKYRESNTEATYDPEWHHSTQLEVVIWTAPLVIIIMLGAITWLSTHTLDPYRPLTPMDVSNPIPSNAKPLEVDVVALDWKWLFFYREQGIATVNDLAAPVHVPIAFHITSANVMNSFFIPALAGQIYAMAGMVTPLHAIMEKPGVYRGLSANYSGSGFSRMDFTFRALSAADFDAWVGKAKSQGARLDRAAYMKLQEPSQDVPPTYFAQFETDLFDRILNLCVRPGSMCINEMNAIDAKGGGGIDSEGNVERLQYDDLRVQSGHEATGTSIPVAGRPVQSNVEAPAPGPGEPTNQKQPPAMPSMGQTHATPGGPEVSAPAPSSGRQGLPGQ